MSIEKPDDEKQPEYTLVASDPTAYIGIIRNTKTNEFYRSYGAIFWEFIPTDHRKVHSIVANAILIAYHPEIPLKNPSEWAEKARDDKRRLQWSPTGGPNAPDARARKIYSKA